MNVLVVVKNTTKLPLKAWQEFTQEVTDCISDHAVLIRSTSGTAGAEMSWVAEFNDVGEDVAIAKAALTAIASKPGGEYAWLGVTEAEVTV